MKANLLTCLIFTTCLFGYSQAEASHWYFGNGAGLVFDVNTGTVTSTDAASNTINTNEGCSSISDFNGNLLFYTDGRNVWDKNHSIMSNANYNSGTGLMGDPSSTSSGLIVPKPGDPNQYYIFTVDEPHHQNAFAFPNQGPAEANGSSTNEYDSGGGVPGADDGFNNGLAYSLVDLTLNNGNGNVVSAEKNIQLVTYDPNEQGQESYKCSEKITAVEHSDKQSYWVLTQFIDNFYAFRVDAAGVNTTPVETNIIPLINFEGYRRNAIGYMKASPDGSRIAVCHRQNGNQPGGFSNNTGSVWIYDFDNTTGNLSNPINLLPNFGPYSVEFSPDSSKLYVSGSNSVTQFDLNTSDPASTDFMVYSGFNFIGALQLGPDGKIYIANTEDSQSLDVINDPNTYGVDANYVPYQVQLAPGTFSNIGLPPFIQSFFLASIQLENSCVGQDVNFSVNSTQVFDSIAWDFGDGTGTANENNPSYIFSTPGTYTVSAEITAGTEVLTFTEDIIISQNPTAFPADDLFICDDNNDGVFSFTFQESGDDIINGQDTAVYSISYHLSLADAETNSNAINLPYQNTNSTEEIFARIENNINSNCFDTTSFEINVFDTPEIATDVIVFRCDDGSDGNPSNGQTEIDLFLLDELIIGSQDPSNLNISYHINQDDADNDINGLPLLFYNTTPFTQTLVVRVENINNENCYTTGLLEVLVNPSPVANTVDDILECDVDNDGLFSFDFVESQNQVLGGQDPTAFTLTYYLSQDDADAKTNPLTLPYQNTNITEEIFVRIENNNNTTCFDTTSFNLTVFDTPNANAVQTVEECDNLDDGNNANGQIEINLNNFDGDVLGAQDNTLFSVSYHLTQGDANNNDNPIISPYYNTTPFSYQIFARIENNLKTECYDTTVFTVNISATPTANDAGDIFECDDNDDGVLFFDFADAQTQVLNNQNATDFSITFHSSLEDAETNSNAINLPYQNTNSTEEIFVRIENNNNTTCFDTTSFSLTVFDTPTANVVQTVEECDNLDDGNNANGQREINLNNFDGDVLGTQNNTLFSVSYHLTQGDANNNDNPITSPYYNTTPFSYQIFARIENNLKTDCFDTTLFTVNINPIPVAFDTTLVQCDEDGVNDGFTIFNLDEANSAVTNGVSGLSTKFFSLESDAQNSTGEISAAPFTNTANPQIIYVQVIDDNTGCFDISQISLEVSLTSGNNSELKSCDNDGIEDGFKSFTLSNATPSILAGLPSDYNLAYYETYENALLEQNPLSNTFTNTNAYNQIIYARIENNNQCYGINELELTVFELPQLDQGDQTFFCIDSNSGPVFLNSGIIGNPSDYSYVWSSGEITEEIEINQGGAYTVTVTNSNNCTQSKSITVVNSNIATIETIDINDVSSNNTISIIATGDGDYEYALDNISGPYQDDITFYNVTPGFHTVYVRDKNGCGTANETVSVIGFPNFFTPNDDGYNDTWHIYGINTPSQSGSEIYIFDRYGKLLKQLLYNSSGWDGTYNGNPMPTSDYWFYIKLGDNRIFRGHFTLKR